MSSSHPHMKHLPCRQRSQASGHPSGYEPLSPLLNYGEKDSRSVSQCVALKVGFYSKLRERANHSISLLIQSGFHSKAIEVVYIPKLVKNDIIYSIKVWSII